MREKFTKFLTFPWGYFEVLALGVTISAIVTDVLVDVGGYNKLWVYIGIIISGLIIVSLLYFTIYRVNKLKYNICVMLIPSEDLELDKFVKNDISPRLNEIESQEINFIVPHYPCRSAFCYIEKLYKNPHDFINSSYFKYFSKISKASAILSGAIKKRKEGDDVYEVKLRVYYLINYKASKELKQFIEKNLNSVFQKQVLLNAKKELSEYERLTNYINDVMQFIIGASKLSGGNVDEAFKIHYECLKRSALKENKAFLNTLALEAHILYLTKIYYHRYSDARFFVDILNQINPENKIYIETQFLMYSATSETEMLENAKKCFKMLHGGLFSVNYLLNKAYICLILGYIKKSEKLYAEFFKKYTPKYQGLITSVKMYCNFTYSKEFERPYTTFLIGLLQFHIDHQHENAMQCFIKVKSIVQPDSYLYKRSDYYINLIQRAKKTR